MKTKLLISIILSITLIAIVAKANAQEVLRTFTISPPAVQVSLDPGKTSEGTLKIINDGDNPLTFQTSLQDFIVKDDLGTPDILPPDTLSNKYSGASWIAIYPQAVTVQPHQRAEFNYYIQIPLNARPGGHYAAVMYTPTNTIGVTGTGASVNTSVGTLFYITVNGPVSIKATLTNFLTKTLWDFGPVTFKAKIQNYSDVHITPKGDVSLTNMLGQKSYSKSITTYNIFPGVARNYSTTLGKQFMLGLYKAQLKATYGPNNAPLLATASFIVFPWKIAVFIILMVIVIFVGYRYWKTGGLKLRKHHEEPSEPTSPEQ